jgi:molecular chaperone DnaK (HSP70)
MKRLSLGMDIGTSKFCISVYEFDTKKINCLTFNGDVIVPTTIFIPRSDTNKLAFFTDFLERPSEDTHIVIDSTKRCVICQWSSHSKNEIISSQVCVNPRNYNNKDWCKEGKQQFMLGQFEWNPEILFVQLLNYSINLAKDTLAEEYKNKDYVISEVKIGVPMIFHRGEFYVSWLAGRIKEIVHTSLGHKLEKNTLIDIVHEPIATLMAQHRYGSSKLPDGYFLVIDSGAGTTDIVLCKKAADKISFVDFDSWNIAGDDYDVAIEKIIEENISKLGLPMPQVRHICKQYAKQSKEYYCNTASDPTVSLPGFNPIVISRKEIENRFSKINECIVDRIKNFISNYFGNKSGIRKVYLSGGCIKVVSLESKIQDATGVSAKDSLKIRLSDPDLANFDPMIVSVSAGAALPKDEYLKVVFCRLPINITVEVGTDALEIDKKFKVIKLLYEANQENSSGKVDLRDIDHNKDLILMVISPKNGERRTLTTINTNRFYRERKKRKSLTITLRYIVEYNGKLSIVASSNHVPEQREIYNNFVLF